MTARNYSVVPMEGTDRFIIIDSYTGEILDDAQGYGYRTEEKAHKAFVWKSNNTIKK